MVTTSLTTGSPFALVTRPWMVSEVAVAVALVRV